MTDKPEETPKTAGQVAFETYCEVVGGKTYDDKPIPKYEDLPEKVKEAWEKAIEAAFGYAFR